MKGYGIGIFELLFFFLVSGSIRAYSSSLKTINKISYYTFIEVIKAAQIAYAA